MMHRCRIAVPLVAGIAVAMAPRPARAGASACTRVAIEADTSLGNRGPELLAHVLEAFEQRDDVDRCARVVLTRDENGIGIDVMLADGRTAHRSVSRTEDVVPVLEALLILPNARPAIELSTASATTPPSDSVVAPTVSMTPRDAPHSSPGRPSGLGIDLSAETGARIGDGQVSLGLGAVSFLDVSGWLLGFTGRADSYRMLSGARSGAALELGVLGGRRIRFENEAVDLFGGLAAALQGTSGSESSATASTSANANAGGAATGCSRVPGACVQSASNSSTVPRLVLGARLTFGARSTVRTFVGVDGDFGPARMGDVSGIPDAPRLPIWTLGLALGATVGTQ